MREHPDILQHDFDSVPLGRDVIVMDERWRIEYCAALLNMLGGGDYANVGYVSYAAVRSISNDAMEISWYPNIYDRFHEVRISLPRSVFTGCVSCPSYDIDPHIFVSSNWYRQLYLRPYSAFALIDAINFKQALRSGAVSRSSLSELRKRIDQIATRYRSVAFISFADSLILKTNWRVGTYDSFVRYDYRPETLLDVISEVRKAYEEVLSTRIYAVLTQGLNEYYDKSLIQISSTRNHVSLNSLGLPFAQLMSIEQAAKRAIKKGAHGGSELYIDKTFYSSLNHKFDTKRPPSHPYEDPMLTGGGTYYCLEVSVLNEGLAEKQARLSYLLWCVRRVYTLLRAKVREHFSDWN